MIWKAGIASIDMDGIWMAVKPVRTSNLRPTWQARNTVNHALLVKKAEKGEIDHGW